MKTKPVLTAASIYLAIVGLGLMLVPAQFGIDAVPENPPPALIAFLRVLGGPCIGIAVLDWLARNLPPSRSLDAIIIGNIAGFASVSAMDIWGVFSGTARSAGKIFLAIHLLMTIAFFLARRFASQERGERA